MEKLVLVITFLFSSFLIHGQVFVNHAATGSNNGQSWQDAYVTLDDAIINGQINSEIWVAAGIYKPGGNSSTRDNYFDIDKDVKIFGGFIGTETSIMERDIEVNQTILSGDLLDNDIAGDFTTNRDDNSRHIMWIRENVTEEMLLDGIVFTNGHADGQDGGSDNRRAGAILCYGSPTIENCTFEYNSAFLGGAIYMIQSPRESNVINCTFRNNYGEESGGAFYAFTTFINVVSTTFIDNIAPRFGGAMNINATTNRLTNCIFDGNGPESLATGGQGGHIAYANTVDVEVMSSTIIDSEFLNAINLSRGGAIHNSANNNKFVIRKTIFEGNEAPSNFGGACNFNVADVEMDSCRFENNIARSGGAIRIDDDISRLKISNTTFVGNVASERAGAIWFIAGFGEYPPIPSVFDINKCIFTNNVAGLAGGAIESYDANITANNSLFVNNSVLNEESDNNAGGAILIRKEVPANIYLEYQNTTFANNSAFKGNGIATIATTDDSEGDFNVNLRNCILSNPGNDNFDKVIGKSNVFSDDGNLSSDASLAANLTLANDVNGTDPLFLDEENANYRLSNESPCIDTGVENNNSSTDIEGLPLVGIRDKGAHEYQGLVNILETEIGAMHLSLIPNPVHVSLNVKSKLNVSGRVSIYIYDMVGQKAADIEMGNTENGILESVIDVSDLDPKLYILKVVIQDLNGKQHEASTSFNKI